MGMYINPPAEEFGSAAKESWIIRHITQIKDAREIQKEMFINLDFSEVDSNNEVALILIDNVAFTTLAVCYSQDELIDWQKQSRSDSRRMWFLICNKESAFQYAE